MAIYDLPKPGSKYGPCADGCEHADCAETRRQAEGACPLCGKVVGYDVPVVFLSRDLPEGHDVVHADCLAELDDLILPGSREFVDPTRWEGATKEWDVGDVGVVDDGELPATLRTSDHLRFEGDYGAGFRPVTLRTASLSLRTLARLRASRAASDGSA